MALLARSPISAAALRALREVVGPSGVSADDSDRLAYVRDAWARDAIRARGALVQAAPEAVVWPRSPEEVESVVSLAAELGLPVVPYGGGTGRYGGARPSHGGLVLSTERLTHIGPPNLEDGWVEVEAGVRGASLEARLRRDGLTLGHAPISGAVATVGGWIATASAALSGERYGLVERMVRRLEVVGPKGRAYAELGARSSAFLEWGELMVGWEGRFGILTGARLGVQPIPEVQMLAAYRFRSFEAGVEALHRMMQVGLRPFVGRLADAKDRLLGRTSGDDASEVSNLPKLAARLAETPPARGLGRLGASVLRATARAALGSPRLVTRALEVLPGDVLLVLGFEGSKRLAFAESDLGRQIARSFDGVELGADPARAWLARRAAGMGRGPRLERLGLFEDHLAASTTWDRVLPLYRRVREELSGEAVVSCQIGHADAVGCAFELTLTRSLGRPADAEGTVERHRKMWHRALSVVVEAGGTLAHHAGFGEADLDVVARQLGPGRRRMLAALGQAVDPDATLNPGKVVTDRFPPPPPRIPRAVGGLPESFRAVVGARNLRKEGTWEVVSPPDERALAALLRVAQSKGLGILSDQCAAPPERPSIRIDLRHLDGIVRISETAGFVEVESGARVSDVERALGHQDLTLGPLDARADGVTVGRAAALGLLDRRGPAFGPLREAVVGGRALLASGDPVEMPARPRAGVGPASIRFFVGSGGRFGILTKLRLRIYPVPAAQSRLGARLSDLACGVRALHTLIDAGVRPASAELVPTDGRAELSCTLVAPSPAMLSAQIAAFESAIRPGVAIAAPTPQPLSEFLAIEVTWSQILPVYRAISELGLEGWWLAFACPRGASWLGPAVSAAAETRIEAAVAEIGARWLDAPRAHPALVRTTRRMAAALDPAGVLSDPE